MLRTVLPWSLFAASFLAVLPIGEPSAAALKCLPPRGMLILERVSVELLEGTASVANEEARLDASTYFDAGFLPLTEDETIYFERTP
jgi:hypothetical protein